MCSKCIKYIWRWLKATNGQLRECHSKVEQCVSPLWPVVFIRMQNCSNTRRSAGRIQAGGSLGSDESPSETKEFFEWIVVGWRLNLVRCDGKKRIKRTPSSDCDDWKKVIILGEEDEPPQDNPGSATALRVPFYASSKLWHHRFIGFVRAT